MRDHKGMLGPEGRALFSLLLRVLARFGACPCSLCSLVLGGLGSLDQESVSLFLGA